MSGLTLRAYDTVLSGRWPTLVELEQAASREPPALKKLVKACLPDAGELLKKKPAAFMKLALIVMGLSGVGGPLTEINEDELSDDDPMVGPWAEALKKGFSGLHLLRYTREEPALNVSLLVREPNEREVDEYLANESFPASKKLVKKLCVNGDIDALDNTAPGLVRAITMFLLERVGLTDEVLVGEA